MKKSLVLIFLAYLTACSSDRNQGDDSDDVLNDGNSALSKSELTNIDWVLLTGWNSDTVKLSREIDPQTTQSLFRFVSDSRIEHRIQESEDDNRIKNYDFNLEKGSFKILNDSLIDIRLKGLIGIYEEFDFVSTYRTKRLSENELQLIRIDTRKEEYNAMDVIEVETK